MIVAALNAYALKKERSFSYDRSQTVGASSVGRCARMVFFEKNEGDAVYGRKRNEDVAESWGARVRGTVMEDHFWYPALLARYGDRLQLSGPNQRTLVSGFLSATPDGLLVDCAADDLQHLGIKDVEGDSVVLEAKSIDPRSRIDEPKPEHVFQVQVQLGLIRELTNHRPAWGLISYTDASFWDVVKEFPVRFDPAVYAVAKERARDIMLARGVADVRPEGIIAGGKECDLCAFTDACGKARADRVPDAVAPVDPLLVETIADLARHARAAKAEAEAKAQEVRDTEAEIRDLLAAAGTKKVDAGGVKVQWSGVKGRVSWDNTGIREAAAAAGIDLKPFERTGDASDRLSITLYDGANHA